MGSARNRRMFWAISRALSGGVGTRNDEAEFVAAKARHHAPAGRQILETARRRLQQLVADFMAIGVVHLLETVEIGEDQRQSLGFGMGFDRLFIQRIDDLPAIWQAGQVVAQRRIRWPVS